MKIVTGGRSAVTLERDRSRSKKTTAEISSMKVIAAKPASFGIRGKGSQRSDLDGEWAGKEGVACISGSAA
jgi:hypothetical protein